MFVEQILIGGALLFIVFLLFFDFPPLKIPEKWTINESLVSVILGAFCLGAAYFLGMLYDRVADTLLEDQEKRSRLRYALERYENKKVSFSAKDLFPENILRIQIFNARSGISEHTSYLRSRIRLLRALTTLIPALTVSYVIYGLMEGQKGWPYLRIVGTGGLFLIYSLVFLYKILSGVSEKKKEYKIWHWLSKWREDTVQDVPPKTFIDYKKHFNMKELLNDIEKHLDQIWALRDPVFLGLWLLIILSAVLGFSIEKISTFWILPFLGLFLTMLCGWAFLRVHQTFLSLLDDYHEYMKSQNLPADTPNTQADY
jgi:hypothetical protein